MKSLFLLTLGGANPARILAGLGSLARGDLEPDEVTGALGRPSRARLHVAALLLRHMERNTNHEAEVASVVHWATTEAVNILVGQGSHQKLACPVNDVPGSGRWQARDNGGAYRLLLDAGLERGRLNQCQVEALERAFDLFGLATWRQLIAAAMPTAE